MLEVRAPPEGAIAWPLRVRGRRGGDRFRPEGGRGSKKLKAWLIDRKVPREERDALLVVADADGWVLLVPSLGARAEGAGAFLAVRPGA
jgi:tRNA(Ile)-lysidine synthase